MTARQKIGPKFDGWVGPWRLSPRFGWSRFFRCFEHHGDLHRWAVPLPDEEPPSLSIAGQYPDIAEDMARPIWGQP